MERTGVREDSRDSGQGEDRGEGGGQAHTRDPWRWSLRLASLAAVILRNKER